MFGDGAEWRTANPVVGTQLGAYFSEKVVDPLKSFCYIKSTAIKGYDMQKLDLKRQITASVAIVCVLGANLAFAGKSAALDPIKKELRSMPTAEITTQTAKLVSAARPKATEATTTDVVTAAIELKSTTAIAVVSAIARQNKELAPAVAAKAAALLPKEAAVIARSAAGAAPTEAAKIAFAVCKAVPGKYSLIATGVAQVVPAAKQEILAAVASALPTLQPFIDNASANNANEPMGLTMARVEKLVQLAKVDVSASTTVASTPAPRTPFAPPQPGPPFTPYLGNPGQVNVTNTLEVPPGGGRNYFGP